VQTCELTNRNVI